MDSPEERSPLRKIPKWLPTALGYLVSAGCLWWVFQGVDHRQIVRDFSLLNWHWVTIAVIVDLLVYVCHGWRWGILLRPVGRVSLFRTVQAVYVGLFFNEVLPLRPGEVIRCYLLSFWSRVPLSLSFASAAVERVLDGLWLIVAFLLAVKTTTLERVTVLPPALLEGVQVLAVVLLAAALLFAVVALRKHHVQAAVSRHRWAATLALLIEGLHAMGNSRTLPASAGASFVYLALQVIPVWVLLRDYNIQLSIGAAAAVLIILRIGTVIPNAPGNVGSYNAVCVLALGLFGVDKTTAAGFSVVLWSVLTVPLLFGGLVAVLISGLKLDEVRRHAHANQPPGI